MAGVKNAIGKSIVDQTFVVVGKNQCVELLEGIEQGAKEFFFGCGSESIAALLINADNLLVTGDDASLNSGYALRISKQAEIADAASRRQARQNASGFII